MKTVLALVLLGALQLCVATPLPEPGLLRVPRIYNALITTDAKLQPSRASPYSIPAVPVIGPAPVEVTRVDGHHTQHHATAKKMHRDSQPDTRTDMDDVPVHGKDGKKLSPSSRMYPETFYPQSVGYYPHPFIPYSYPLAPQPYAFGQYSSAGVGGGPASDSHYLAFGGQGFGPGSGLRAGFGPYSPLRLGPGEKPIPSDFSVEQSSSFHMTSGRKQGEVDIADPEEGDTDEGDATGGEDAYEE